MASLCPFQFTAHQQRSKMAQPKRNCKKTEKRRRKMKSALPLHQFIVVDAANSPAHKLSAAASKQPSHEPCRSARRRSKADLLNCAASPFHNLQPSLRRCPCAAPSSADPVHSCPCHRRSLQPTQPAPYLCYLTRAPLAAAPPSHHRATMAVQSVLLQPREKDESYSKETSEIEKRKQREKKPVREEEKLKKKKED